MCPHAPGLYGCAHGRIRAPSASAWLVCHGRWSALGPRRGARPLKLHVEQVLTGVGACGVPVGEWAHKDLRLATSGTLPGTARTAVRASNLPSSPSSAPRAVSRWTR